MAERSGVGWRAWGLFFVLQAGVLAMPLPEGKGNLNVRKGFRVTDVTIIGSDASFEANRTVGGAVVGSEGVSVQQTLHVDVDMEVIPRLNVRGSFDDTSFPAKKALSLEYTGEKLRVEAGDVRIGFPGTEFPLESQNIFGIRSTYNDGRHAATAALAQLSNAVGTFEAKGDSTRGPYFMPDRNMVVDSERVFVDGQRKFRGTDYEVEFSTGVLEFKEPVDNRLTIRVDYEYTALFSLDTERMVAAQYRHELGDAGTVGVVVGTRDEGLDGSRDVLGVDGQFTLPGGVFLSGEVGRYQDASTSALAVRSEASGRVGRLSLRGGVRRVDPGFNGLGNVSPRPDLLETNVSAGYDGIENLNLSTRLYTTRTNLADDASIPIFTSYVQDNDAVLSLAKTKRLEFTLNNRNEMGFQQLGDLEESLGSRAHSVRVGSRYRLEEHLLSSSYEVRQTLSNPGPEERWVGRHAIQGDVRSRLSKYLYGSTMLQFAYTPDPSGDPLGDPLRELINQYDLSSRIGIFDGSLNYAMQARLGVEQPVSHSGGITLRARASDKLQASTSMRVKGAFAENGQFLGDSTFTSSVGYTPSAKLSFAGSYEQRLAGDLTIGPRVLDLRGNFIPSGSINVAAGLRLEFFEPGNELDDYLSRVAYMEATTNF